MRFLFFFIPLAVLFGCSGTNEKFEITGTISNSKNDLLHLSEFRTDKFVNVDSVYVDNSGKFKFKGKIRLPNFYQISVSDNNYITLIVKPKDHIYMEADRNDLALTLTVNGSEDSKMVKELNDYLNNALLKVDSLGRIYEKSLGESDFLKIKQQLDKSYDSLKSVTRHYTISFIGRNVRSLVSIMALYAQFTPRDNLFDAKSDFAYFSLVDSVLYSLYPASDIVISLHKHVSQVKETIELEKSLNNRIGIGAKPPDIVLPDVKGDTVRLSSLKNKIILVDFWASWCPPCRRENPNLVKIYNDFHKKGFEIFAVSLDKSKEAWLNAIEDDKLEWIHVSDLGQWNSAVVPLYNLQAIPSNFLLDRDGRIIAKNLSAVELRAKLNELID